MPPGVAELRILEIVELDTQANGGSHVSNRGKSAN
jgi:Ser-tRNA(Ala) deacylase AlaX